MRLHLSYISFHISSRAVEKEGVAKRFYTVGTKCPLDKMRCLLVARKVARERKDWAVLRSGSEAIS